MVNILDLFRRRASPRNFAGYDVAPAGDKRAAWEILDLEGETWVGGGDQGFAAGSGAG